MADLCEVGCAFGVLEDGTMCPIHGFGLRPPPSPVVPSDREDERPAGVPSGYPQCSPELGTATSGPLSASHDEWRAWCGYHDGPDPDCKHCDALTAAAKARADERNAE